MPADVPRHGIESFAESLRTFDGALQKHNELYASKKQGAGERRLAFYTELATGNNGKTFLDAWRNENPSLRIGILPDVKGLKIDIGPDGHGIHAHIPYHLLTKKILDGFARDIYARGDMMLYKLYDDDKDWDRNLLNHYYQTALQETFRKNPTSAGITEEMYTTSVKAAEYNTAIASENLYQGDAGGPRDRDFVAHQIFLQPERVADALKSGNSLTNETIEYLLTHEIRGRSLPEKILQLLRIASYVQIDDNASPWMQSQTEPHRNIRVAHVADRILELQKESLKHHAMIQAAKCIDAVLGRYSYTELADMGIHMLSSAYQDGDRMLAFWGHGQYVSVLLRPKQQIDPDHLAQFTETIDTQAPIVKQAEFKTIDAQMRVGVVVREAFDRCFDFNNEGVLTVGYLAPGPEIFVQRIHTIRQILAQEAGDIAEPFLVAADRFVHIVQRSGRIDRDSDVTKTLVATCATAVTTFFDRVFARPTHTLLNERLKNPNRIRVTFRDGAYTASFPSTHIGTHRHDSPFAPELDHTEKTVECVLLESRDAIPFAQAARMMRSLKLEPRNTISCIAGSTYTDSDPETAYRIEHAIYRAAQRTRANVGVNPTQPGYGAILVRSYLADTDPDTFKPDYYSVAPGKNTWFEGNTHFDFSDTKNSYALVPVKTFVTPFPSGYYEAKYDTDAANVQRHNAVLENINAAMADGHTRVTPIINGGLGTIDAMRDVLHHNSPVLCVSDSGRVASVLAHILKRYTPLMDHYDTLTNEETLIPLLKQIQSENTQGAAEIGKMIADPQYIGLFARFLGLAAQKESLFHIATSHTLENTLVNMLGEEALTS